MAIARRRTSKPLTTRPRRGRARRTETKRARRATRARKHVYFFGGGKAEGRSGMRDLLGGKGANLAEMAGLGLPVPPGFTISTDVCTHYYANQRNYPPDLRAHVDAHLARVEKIVGRRFGDPKNPLLVSVRSGARASMPGMMDTVLNLGLNDETVQGLIAASGNARFAWDSYRRFVQMYGDVVLGLKPEDKSQADPFEELLEARKHAGGARADTDLTADDLRELVAEFKALIRRRLNVAFPDDPHEQLWGAIGAVFGSWQNARAITYRKIYGIPDEWGTAVNVQAMVFGNLGDDCATGVAFTRDPATGDNVLYGDFLANAQGPASREGCVDRRGARPEHFRERAAPVARGDDAALLPAAEGDRPPARAALPRHAGPGIHDRTRAPVDAPDPHRQEDRACRGEDRRRPGARAADRP
jgi:pyruvate,phosphate dikinase